MRTKRIGRLIFATMNLGGCGRSRPTAHSHQTQPDANTQPAERAWATHLMYCQAGESKHPCGLMTLTGRTATKPGACKLQAPTCTVTDSVLLAKGEACAALSGSSGASRIHCLSSRGMSAP